MTTSGNSRVKPARQASGITLLELLIVLAIMAVIAVIVYPNLTRIVDTLYLRHDALQLAQEMRACRTEAIMSQQAKSIRFYGSHNYYKIVSTNRVIFLSKGIKIQGTSFRRDGRFFVPYCRFHASGSPSQGGSIMLVNQQGQTKYVIVSVAMARIRVSDSPPDTSEIRD